MRILVVLSLLIAFSGAAMAQNPVTWTVAPVKDAKSVQAGSIIVVELAAKIEDGWRIYSITQGPGGPVPTRITLPTGQGFALSGDIKSSAPKVKFDENFGIDVECHEKEAAFTVPVKVEKAAESGSKELMINVRYQACTVSMCLPPKTEKLKLALAVTRKSL